MTAQSANLFPRKNLYIFPEIQIKFFRTSANFEKKTKTYISDYFSW